MIRERGEAQTHRSRLLAERGQQQKTTERNSEQVQEKMEFQGFPRAARNVFARSALPEGFWVGELAAPRFRLPL